MDNRCRVEAALSLPGEASRISVRTRDRYLSWAIILIRIMPGGLAWPFHAVRIRPRDLNMSRVSLPIPKYLYLKRNKRKRRRVTGGCGCGVGNQRWRCGTQERRKLRETSAGPIPPGLVCLMRVHRYRSSLGCSEIWSGFRAVPCLFHRSYLSSAWSKWSSETRARAPARCCDVAFVRFERSYHFAGSS